MISLLLSHVFCCGKGRLRFLLIALVGTFWCLSVFADSGEDARYVNLSKGSAVSSLKKVARLFGVDIIFDPRVVRGVKTPSLNGEYTPCEALDLLLVDTPLVVIQDEELVAFAVKSKRRDDTSSGSKNELNLKSVTANKRTKNNMDENEYGISAGRQNGDRENAKKKKKWYGALAVALSFGMGGASAQESNDVFELEAFVVDGGIAASRQRSLELKRISSNLVDAISAEGLGRFPDENVAESLQRITGVQINRNRGEGSTVNIRGLPSVFTHVLFNGRSLTSALNGDPNGGVNRSFDFSALPSEFISTLRVHKTSTADMEEGGLSGTVDVETASAFFLGKRSVAASVQGAWESNSGEFSPRMSFLFSDVFADGKLGFALGLARSEREPETHTSNGGYANRTESQGLQSSGGPVDFNGNGVIDPDFNVRVSGGHFLNIFKEKRERNSAIAKLEFRPNRDVDLFVESFYTEQKIESERFENLHRFVNAQGIDPMGTTEVLTIDGINYLAETDGLGVDLRGGSRFEDRNGDALSITFGGERRFDSWTLSGEVSVSESTQLSNNLNIADIARGSILYVSEPGTDSPQIEYQDGFEEGRLNPNNFQVASLNGSFQRRNNDDQTDGRVDLERIAEWGPLKKLKFGVRYSEREQNSSNGRLVIGGAALSDLVGGLAEGPGGPGTFSAASFMQLVEPGNGSFLDSFSGHDNFPQTWLGSDTKGFLEQYSNEELIAAGNFTNAVTGIIDVEEEVTAGYGMVEFGSKDGRLSGNFGIRFVNTNQLSRGNAPDLTRITLEPEAGAVTTIPPGEDVVVDRSYSDVLPSANLKWEVSDEVVMRFAASRTMARPNLSQISPIATANGNNSTITRQNPLLDPFRSNNFDISTEWYMGDHGALTVSLFYKDVISLIRNETSVVDLPIIILLSDGTSFVEDREFTINEPVNGDGVTVKGFEVSYQRPLDFLPIEGFGFLANYTYINNSDPEQLTAASENNFNLSSYYETERVGVRLSYTWRDGFLTNPGSATGDGTLRDSFGVLDGNITYNINENLSLVLEAINILDEAVVERTLTGLPTSYIDSGRRILFGAKMHF
ncbi:TonB-dependent receptor [Puniceicoccaceae bacterium K14]|nr:TonB-dependent receptor [Puniceicoccaceae bacterium K14]